MYWPAGLANITCTPQRGQGILVVRSSPHLLVSFLKTANLVYRSFIPCKAQQHPWQDHLASVLSTSRFWSFRQACWSIPPSPHFEFLRALGKGTATAMCCDLAATLLVLKQEVSSWLVAGLPAWSSTALQPTGSPVWIQAMLSTPVLLFLTHPYFIRTILNRPLITLYRTGQ